MSSFKDSEFQDFSVEFGLGLFSEKKESLSQEIGGGGGHSHPKNPHSYTPISRYHHQTVNYMIVYIKSSEK